MNWPPTEIVARHHAEHAKSITDQSADTLRRFFYIWDQITKSLNFGLGAAAGVVLFLITSFITLIFVYLLRDK